jgi:CMP-N-acetylneuraminic acid synthetase
VLSYFPDADIVCKLYPCIPLIESNDIETLYRCHIKWFDDGTYYVGDNKKDAGACYIFRAHEFYRYRSIALDRFPWSPYITFNACDINTPKDLEIAKQKAGL